MGLSKTIAIDLSEVSKSEAVFQLMKSFLLEHTVCINDTILADYSPYEGLRFEDMSGTFVDFYASCDGKQVDVGQAALDLYEYASREPLARPSRLNAWTGRVSDDTHESSIPSRW